MKMTLYNKHFSVTMAQWDYTLKLERHQENTNRAKETTWKHIEQEEEEVYRNRNRLTTILV